MNIYRKYKLKHLHAHCQIGFADIKNIYFVVFKQIVMFGLHFSDFK